MEITKIGFIGLGLIGGSIAKKLKADNPKLQVIARANADHTVEEAYKLGLIENDKEIELKYFSDCDIVFLCAPVEENISYLEELKKYLKKDCLITDVGSTKTAIHEEVARLGLEEVFVGGHPMAGTEKNGVMSANAYLFENAYYILTPTGKTRPELLECMRSLVESLDAIPLILTYEMHDQATASISHLPHMIAFSLVNLIKELDDENHTRKTIAAGAFRDITRVASSSPVMWKSICLSNRQPILSLMDAFIEHFQGLRKSIAESDSSALLKEFQSAKDYRDSIIVPANNQNAVICDCYVDLADETGGIATIATILAFKGISIKNIGILHNREFEDGVLHIEFYDGKAKEFAIDLLRSHNYQVYHRK